jgi:cytochrome b561
MNGSHQRFTPLQRLLHWLLAACIFAQLFIGVGMESTVLPKYLTCARARRRCPPTCRGP